MSAERDELNGKQFSATPLTSIGLSPPDWLDRRSLPELRKNQQPSATTRKRDEDQVCMYNERQ
jgi:hypothetical protein